MGYYCTFQILTLAKAERDRGGVRMKKNPITTIYLILLLFHAHLSICNGLVSISVVGLNSVKNNEIKAIPKRNCGGEVGQCLGEEMDWEWEKSNRRVLVM